MDKSKLDNAVSGAGRSLLEMLWEELDVIMDKLMEEGAPEDVPPTPTMENRAPLAAWRTEWLEYGETRGQAQGVAYAIAVIERPYEPDVPGIKERAVERWEERQDDGQAQREGEGEGEAEG